MTVDVIGTYDGQRAPGTAFTSGTFAPTGGDTSPYSFVEIAGSPFSAEVLGADQPSLRRNIYDLNVTANYAPQGPWSFAAVAGYRNFDSLEVFDADGSSIIVHAQPDTYCDAESDLKKGCAGGAREACGVLKAVK
jgi:hypothetical protein